MHFPTRRSFRLAALLGGTLLLALSAPAQQQGPIVSPEVLPDRTVVFRLRAPNATNVAVSGQFQKGAVPLATNAPGVWTATVGPVTEYSFSVDGLGMIDPGNRAIKPMRAPRTSILEIPGDPPLDHDFQSVPHGSVHLHWYASRALGVRRAPCRSHTPPGTRSPGSVTRRSPVPRLRRQRGHLGRPRPRALDPRQPDRPGPRPAHGGRPARRPRRPTASARHPRRNRRPQPQHHRLPERSPR